MKSAILLLVIAHFQLSLAFMSTIEFGLSGLLRCYDTNMQDGRRISLRNINGQVLPLPNSIETFISLMERYESLNPNNNQARDFLLKLLQSYRIDDLKPKLKDEVSTRDTQSAQQNILKRAIFNIPNIIRNDFGDDDFTEDESCALHLMLSHTINDTRIDETDEALENDKTKSKYPRETGVVSLNSNQNHAFALGRVLLGIYAAYMPNNDEDAIAILRRLGKTGDDSLRNVKVNLVYAATIGDLVTRLMVDDIKVLPKGTWKEISCPTEYQLEDNNGGFVSVSELLGAIDGLIIGRKIQENRDAYTQFRLSQILRMYYGSSGLLDNERTRWCNRERNFNIIPNFQDEMLSFNKLYKATNLAIPGQTALDKINNAITEIRNTVFKDIDWSECSISETSPDRKYVTPSNIFAILDTSSPAKLDFQIEVIGNLSSNFDLRPRGNLMGIYTNLKPLQQYTIDTIVKNTGIAGCPSCFAKYYSRTGSKEEEAEIFRDLNHTLANFEKEYEELEEKYQSGIKAGSPGKIVLYFNFGSPSDDYRLQEALWELKRYFGGVTILAVGDKRDNLKYFVDNEQLDIFTEANPLTAAKKITERIKKTPAEFTYKACAQSTPSREAENKQEVFIPMNKIQYWAMYPQYFLRSFGIKLKFKPQDGTQIKVCFSRSYDAIIQNNHAYCKDSSGAEIEFYTDNPCRRRNIFNCDPFYFSVEGKKQPQVPCESLRCSSPTDIQFEFSHEGISCNVGSYVSVSSIALLFAAMMFYFQRQ